MEEDSHSLTVGGDTVSARGLINSSHKDDLGYPKADAQVDVDEVTQTDQWSALTLKDFVIDSSTQVT